LLEIQGFYLSLILLLYILLIQPRAAAICNRLQHNRVPSALLILYGPSISYAYFLKKKLQSFYSKPMTHFGNVIDYLK